MPAGGDPEQGKTEECGERQQVVLKAGQERWGKFVEPDTFKMFS